ncbi:MAG TPA: alpha/beta hydrolase-fold protein [bacterium]|nr:alpha/beta hydrolase-fold protein [bacterium]HPR87523.1 alpha/beta hydrolase-fold protein [bacterium]
MRKWMVVLFVAATLAGCVMRKNEPARRFERLLSRIERNGDAAQKQQLVDEFFRDLQPGAYPFFPSDTAYVLVYRGAKDSVGVLGDMNNWTQAAWMTHVAGTDLFYHRGTAPAGARLEYWFVFGKNSLWSVDPLNPAKSLNGFGELSELAMPRYEQHPFFAEYRSGRKGSAAGLKVHEMDSAVLGYPHAIHVYLPPGYATTQRYPALYLQDGIDYVEFAQVPQMLDQLIRSRRIRPLIAVFVTPPNRFQPGMPNRMTEYGLNDTYVRFFADELVPFIGRTYAALDDPRARLVAGDSFGGLISAYIPFLRPEVFGYGYSQSGYLSFKGDTLIRLYRDTPKRPVRLYVDSGTYEETVGASFLPAAETNFIAANRRFEKVLAAQGYEFVYREYPEGHTWGNWRRHLIDALIWFFPGEKP